MHETALGELRWHWGDAYVIFDEPWRARRRDGRGGWITASDAEELFGLVTADYEREPVSRDAR